MSKYVQWFQAMEYFEFSNGVKMPMVGLGTYPLLGEELANTIEIATNTGYELFDTAISYHNEKEIGALLRKRKESTEKIFITSKVSRVILTGSLNFLFLNRKTVSSAYKSSCDNLGMPKLGAYLLHYPFVGCSKHYQDLIKLFEEDKVNAIGVSNFNIEELKELYRKCGRWPMINQTEISPYNTQKELIDFCNDHGILVQAYSPFGRGNLVREIMHDNVLTRIAKNHDCMVGQIVLRFLVQQGVAVVSRSTNKERLKQNIDIFEIQLDKKEMSDIFSLNKNAVFGKNQINKNGKSKIKI